jgi:putative thymidine phosphorylase
MIVVPIVAACGFKMPKTSSRAITSPAGTADVMEVLAKVNFTPEQIEHIVNTVGGCIVWGGHLGIAPADDIIIKVEEPLSYESFDKIIVSIMAKKIAVSTTHLIIDIPVGRTMKVKYQKDAEVVKQKFEEIAHKFGIHILVDLNKTEMPAGNGVGPYLEAIDVLKVLEQTEDRPIDLEARSLRLAGKLLQLCYDSSNTKKDGLKEAEEVLRSGKALSKFKEIIKAQYGNPNITSHDLKLPSHRHDAPCGKSGTIREINNINLNSVAKILGSPEDKKAGIALYKRIGDKVKKDEICMTLYATSAYHLEEAVGTIAHFPIYTIE